MKKTIPVILLGLLLATATFAQVKITPMKVIYVRQQADLPDYKQRFEITYPMVSGTRSETVRRRLENTLSYWRAFESSLEENLSEYPALDSADYQVTYNKGAILVIKLIWEGSGAHPSVDVRTYTIDTNVGRRITIRQAFQNLPDLVDKLVEMQKAEVEQDLKEWKETDPDAEEIIVSEMEDKTITEAMLDEFSVTDEGVTFHFEYGFPYAVRNLQPVGEYSFSWKDITPYLKVRGPLGRFRSTD